MNDPKLTGRWKLARGILIFAAVTYGVLPAIIDSQDPEHLMNPTWPPHARLHLMWLIAMGLYLSLYSMYLFWTARPGDLHRVRTGAIIGACQVGGFYTAGLFKSAAGAAFDADGRVIFGFVPPALVHLSISGVLLLVGYLTARGAASSQPNTVREAG